MEAATTPATAPRAPSPEGGDWLRMLGGVAFAVGAVALFIRKSGATSSSDWADFPLLLVAAIPCGLLFGVGVSGRQVGEIPRWRAVLMVTGVLLAPLALEQLRETLGLSETANFWHFLIFALVVAMAAYASFIVGAAYQALLAALAGIVAWVYFWEWILDNPGINAFRWLLIILGLGYLGAALALRADNAPQGNELITAAGIVGVIVGVLGVSSAATEAVSPFGVTGGGEGQGFFWDLILLVVSLASVAYGAVTHARGPAYVGFFGLVFFVLLVGLEANELLKGERPDGAFVGWPLALLLIGGGALAAGVAAQRQTGR